MLFSYLDQNAIIYNQSILISPQSQVAFQSFATRECNQFWDPVEARICPSYLPYICIFPSLGGAIIVLGHVLRLGISYRPRWLRPFVEEVIPRETFKQARSYRDMETYVPITGGVSRAGMVAILRPRTTPISLLILYTSIAVSNVIIMVETHSFQFQNGQKILPIQLVLAIFAIVTIFNMPLRDPRLFNDEIAPVFTTSTFEFKTPEDNLTLFQYFTVSWMAPLIDMGKERQLNHEDVWAPSYEFETAHIHENFRELKGSVVMRIAEANVVDLVIQSVTGVVDLMTTFAGPILLQQLLRAMENPLAPTSAAIKYAVAALVVRLISTQLGVINLWHCRRSFERTRGALFCMLYEKSLSRKIIGADEKEADREDNSIGGVGHNQEQPKKDFATRLYESLAKPFRKLAFLGKPKEVARNRSSMGKTLNILRNDIYAISQRLWEFQNLITKPLGLVFSVILIWKLIGWPCLIGVCTVVTGQIVNALFARALLRWERIRRNATDSKLQQVSQFVEAIRHLRWYAWQNSWLVQVMEARKHELDLRVVTGLWNILIAFTNELSSGLFPVAAFYAYSVLAGQRLSVDIAFPALQVFSMLETNLRDLPGLITVLLDAYVSAGRINDFLAEPDVDDQRWKEHGKSKARDNQQPNGTFDASGIIEVEIDPPSTGLLELKGASFAWPGRTDTVLNDVTLSFPLGLTVICGEVGSGKTALLQAMLGELDNKGGEFSRPDEMIAYCAQTPWLQSMSIRDNILFASPYEEERYKKVLEVCALVLDMANFKHGDMSNIGESGIGLSGGQRARVALARAVYSRAKILLLDDPISALDHQTAEFIVKNCLAGSLMRDRKVILVTHRTELCHGLAQQIVEVSGGSVRTLDIDEVMQNITPRTDNSDSTLAGEETEEQNDKALDKPEKFIEDEHRVHGGVKAAVYWEYIKAGRFKWWAILIALLAIVRLVDVGETWFLKAWGEAYDTPFYTTGPLDGLPSPEDNVRPWLIGFTVIAFVKSGMFLFSKCFMLVIVYCTGATMFRDVLTRVSHASFRFYDVTPIGRLMNRLTSDINTIDGNISSKFEAAAFLAISWTTSLVVIGSVTPIFLVFSIVLTISFVVIFLHFLPTSQDLRRLEFVSLTPLMSDFVALVDGLPTVRAFCAQHRFQNGVIAVTDAFSKMDHFYWSLQAWLGYRFDILSGCSSLILTLIAIYTGISSGLTAFVLIAASQFVNATHLICRIYGQLQMDFVSVERIVELLHLDQEKPGEISPPAWWPSLNGDIMFEDVTIKYAPHLDPSLSNLTFHIPAGSQTVIVGRTGSGKSTLAMALLATVIPSEGRIMIDNIDIATVDKQALRQRITFVAQDPVLFPGSMRRNLDPLGEYEDKECEDVLAKICGRYKWTLDTNVEAGGRNLSQGQRQLIGLARTLLRRSPIVILDEATASIDVETSKIIQDILYTEMKGRTVITIAHRLEAVKHADYFPEIVALKFAACLCTDTLERFHERFKPFDDSLGVGSHTSRLKAVLRMVRWELPVKKDIPEFRSYLVVHVGSLNLRLSTTMLLEIILPGTLRNDIYRSAGMTATPPKRLSNAMDQQLDKTLNRKNNVKYLAIDAERQVRLLRIPAHKIHDVNNYTLETIPLADLCRTYYKALSYTWGQAHVPHDIREIQLDGQPLFIRQNLFDFLETANAKGEQGLFFIDAISINQLDVKERQSQVAEMARIYRNADEVITWLGRPDTRQLENVQALSQATSSCVSWTTAQWEGFRYLSHHSYWNRVWIVQEVLLASSMAIWCGSLTFLPTLFNTPLAPLPSPKTSIAENGRPMNVGSALSRLRTPAHTIVTHRLRPILRLPRDDLAQGTDVKTWEEMEIELRKPSIVVGTYQSQVPDPIYRIVREFSKLDCSDLRDRLYGFLGLIHQRSRAKVKPDYSRDVKYAYYQTLKIGLEEMYYDARPLFSDRNRDTYLGYYCDVRDAFCMADGESLSILRHVLDELHFHTRMRDAFFEDQAQQQFGWSGSGMSAFPDFKQLFGDALNDEEEPSGPESSLLKFHNRQHIVAGNLMSWISRRFNVINYAKTLARNPPRGDIGFKSINLYHNVLIKRLGSNET
ncbi:hypothetical protein B7494_g5061 [Chlorociboria aeruginascens]|nr:hypothetical protein B7494_g5061 [Chlorociboria aeruginascens]